jgi:hypothetical protein
MLQDDRPLLVLVSGGGTLLQPTQLIKPVEPHAFVFPRAYWHDALTFSSFCTCPLSGSVFVPFRGSATIRITISTVGDAK